MYVTTARFYRPSAPLSAALESLPGYLKHMQAMEALKEPLSDWKKLQQQHESAADNAATKLANDLLSASPSEDNYTFVSMHAGAAAEAAERAREAEDRVKFLEATEQLLGTELDNIMRGAANPLLKHLDGTLKAAYAESHKLGLQGIHDAEQAITEGKSGEWAKMLELRTVVYQCRTAQADVINRLGTLENIQHLATFGTLENYADVDPTFLERRTSGRWGNEHLTAPWPTQQDGSIDPADMHAFILDHPDDARPWIPTERELLAAVKTAHTEARAAMNAAHAAQES